jgi:hypothetical protein
MIEFDHVKKLIDEAYLLGVRHGEKQLGRECDAAHDYGYSKGIKDAAEKLHGKMPMAEEPNKDTCANQGAEKSYDADREMAIAEAYVRGCKDTEQKFKNSVYSNEELKEACNKAYEGGVSDTLAQFHEIGPCTYKKVCAHSVHAKQPENKSEEEMREDDALYEKGLNAGYAIAIKEFQNKIEGHFAIHLSDMAVLTERIKKMNEELWQGYTKLSQRIDVLSQEDAYLTLDSFNKFKEKLEKGLQVFEDKFLTVKSNVDDNSDRIYDLEGKIKDRPSRKSIRKMLSKIKQTNVTNILNTPQNAKNSNRKNR